MSNHYKEAIRLTQLETDWKAVAIDYAQRHPADFCRAAKQHNTENWKREALAAGSKIQCIKICREFTGLSLKDAKEWADANYQPK